MKHNSSLKFPTRNICYTNQSGKETYHHHHHFFSSKDAFGEVVECVSGKWWTLWSSKFNREDTMFLVLEGFHVYSRKGFFITNHVQFIHYSSSWSSWSLFIVYVYVLFFEWKNICVCHFFCWSLYILQWMFGHHDDDVVVFQMISESFSLSNKRFIILVVFVVFFFFVFFVFFIMKHLFKTWSNTFRMVSRFIFIHLEMFHTTWLEKQSWFSSISLWKWDSICL